MTVSLVTGATRGIGCEVARQLAEDHGHDVLLGARDPERGRAVAAQLRGHVETVRLDVTDPRTVEDLVRRLDALDVLVNNAGVERESDRSAIEPDWDAVRETLDVNLVGAWRVTAAVVPLLRRSAHPRIVNVSSSAGLPAHVDDVDVGSPAYRLSKSSLNVLTKMWARELPGVLVNAACPGWVRTDMGGQAAPRSVGEGAAGLVWLATLPDDGPTGRFFNFGTRVARRAPTPAGAEVPF
jgi:NAD(P)-dependent dehydrogenase (short-subunit alcohol dehydrogenase family)